MDWKRLVALVGSFAATFAPIYLIERLANYYYLIDIPSVFFLVSGLRLPMFVLFALLGSTLSGLLLRDLRSVLATQTAALVSLFSAFYVLCSSSRVCYSTGPDGLEPIRLGFILGSLCVFGGSIGVASRSGSVNDRTPRLLGTLSSFAALVFFPVVYSFGGALFFPLFYPWTLIVLVALAALAASVTLIGLGIRLGFILPILLMGVVMLITAPLAAAYLSDVVSIGLLLASAAVVGSLLGFAARRLLTTPKRGMLLGSIPLAVFLVLILGSFAIIPDEVNGLVPQTGSDSTSKFVMGSPVYAGGFLDEYTTPAKGIAATVSFAGTDQASIQNDNFLSAGIGAHSPDCCVDGIDYGYRFDLYLFQSGNETLLASAWQACDDNTACGGHSWKVLMFSRSGPPVGSPHPQPVYLEIRWVGHSAIWSYRVGSGAVIEFANFTAPPKENPAFNVGVVDVSSALSTQQAAIFYQFGIMSRYPIGHGGWSVTFSCPATLQNGVWSCVSQAEAVEGGSSYWKVLWKWGEDYPNVVVSNSGKDYFSLAYSPNATMTYHQPLFS